MLDPESPFFVFSIFAVFPFLWGGILYFLSRVSGWSSLAEHYQSNKAIDGPKSWFRSMSMGCGTMPVSFSNCVILGTNKSAVSLALIFPLRFFHPKLVIPLSEITAEETRLLGIFPSLTIRFAKTPSVKLRVMRGWGRWIENKSAGNWRVGKDPYDL